MENEFMGERNEVDEVIEKTKAVAAMLFLGSVITSIVYCFANPTPLGIFISLETLPSLFLFVGGCVGVAFLLIPLARALKVKPSHTTDWLDQYGAGKIVVALIIVVFIEELVFRFLLIEIIPITVLAVTIQAVAFGGYHYFNGKDRRTATFAAVVTGGFGVFYGIAYLGFGFWWIYFAHLIYDFAIVGIYRWGKHRRGQTVEMIVETFEEADRLLDSPTEPSGDGE